MIRDNRLENTVQGPRTVEGIWKPFSQPVSGPYTPDPRMEALRNTASGAFNVFARANPVVGLGRAVAGGAQNMVRNIAERQMTQPEQSVGVPIVPQGVPRSITAGTTTNAPRTTSGGGVRTTTQAPVTQGQAPTTEDPLQGAISQLQTAVEGITEPLDRTRRESFVKNLALQLGIPDLLGTDYAQGFISGQVGNRTLGGVETGRSLTEGGVGTSLPVEQDLQGMDREISSRMNDIRNSLPQYELPGDEFRQLLDGRMAMNEATYNELLRSIEQKYNVERENLSNMNRQMVGGTQAFIGRAGAFSSQSGQGAINNEIINAQERMAKLAAEELMALNMAKQARDEGDLQTLQEYLNRSDAARQERNSLARQSFSDEMAAREFAMNESQMLASQARDTLNLLSNLTPDQMQDIDPNYISQLESNLGVPSGFMNQFSNNLRLINQAQSEQEAFDRTMDVLKFAKDVPSGFEFQIGDQTFRGLKGGGGKTFSVEDGRGGVSFVTVDEDTGEVMNLMTLPIGEIKTLTVGGGGGFGGGGGTFGGGDDIAGLGALIALRESVSSNSTVGDFLRNVVSPDQYAQLSSAWGEGMNSTITQSQGIMMLDELGLVDATNPKNFKLINDLTSPDFQYNTSIDSKTGRATITITNKNSPPRINPTTGKVENAQVMQLDQQEAAKSGNPTLWQRVKGFFGGNK
jgi:hypothetical protein